MCKTPACPPVQLLWKKNSVSFLCYLLFMPWGFVQTYLRCRFALFVIRRVTFFQNSTHLFLIQPVSRTFLEYFSKKKTNDYRLLFSIPFHKPFFHSKKAALHTSPHKEQLSLILNLIFQLFRIKSCCRSVHSVFPGSGCSDALYSRLARLLPTIRPKMNVMI